MAGSEPQTFGHVLSRYRRAAGLTQEDLAERAGLSARGVADLERGVRTRPRVSTVRLLADGLGLSPRDRAMFQQAAERPAGPALALENDGRSPLRAVGDMGRRESAIPLMGRTDELRRLDEHLRRAGPPVLLLRGDPGAGKTRLLQEVWEVGGRHGLTVLWGGCQRRSGEEPYAPLVGALSDALRRVPRVEDMVAGWPWIVRLLPELLGGVSEPLPSLAAAQERRLVFDATGHFLQDIGGPRGTLLILDDLQWAGGDTFDLLHALSGRAAEIGLRIVGAYRTTEVSETHPLAIWRGDFAHAQLGAEMAVGPLSQDAAAALLDASLRETSGRTSEIKRRIVERTGGVPFFVLSYAQALQTREWRQGVADAIPSTIAETIRQRIALLPDQGRAVVESAAVIGRIVPARLLVDVLDRSEEEISIGVEAVCRARLMTDDGGQGYRFVHDLIREVVESDLGAVRRSMLHRGVAEAQERRPGRQRFAAELAWHFLQGGDGARALGYSLQAGNAAYAAFANRDAESHYRTALELARDLEDREQEAAALHQLGLAIRRIGRTDESSELLLAAASIYEDLDDLEGAIRALTDFEIHTGANLRRQLISRLSAVVSRAPATPSSSTVRAYASLSGLQWIAGNMVESVRMGERAVAMAELVDDPWARAHAFHALSRGLFAIGTQEEIASATEQAIAAAEEAGDLQRLGVLLMNWSVFAQRRGDWEAATAALERALHLSQRVDDRFRVVMVLLNFGDHWFVQGDWPEAERCWREALAVEQSIGAPTHIADVFVANLTLQQGDMEALDVLKAPAREASDWANQCLAEWEIFTGEPKRARDRLSGGLSAGVEGQHQVSWRTSLAKATLAMGDVEGASALIEAILADSVSRAFRPYTTNALQVNGMVLTAQGRWNEAYDAFHEALEISHDLGGHRPPVLYAMGLMHAAKGEVREARDRFEEALAGFQKLGAKPCGDRTQRALQTLAVLPP